jgi:hypothetical protein
MKTIFYSLHELYLIDLKKKSEENYNLKKNYEIIKKDIKINYEYFLDALVLSSNFSRINEEMDNANIEKVIYLISKMASSKVLKKFQQNSRQSRYIYLLY